MSTHDKVGRAAKETPELPADTKPQDLITTNQKPEVKNKTINLTNKIEKISDKAFEPRAGHSAIVSEFTAEEQDSFKKPIVNPSYKFAVTSLGVETGVPEEIIGPVTIQVDPFQMIYLKAIDKGVFANGNYEVFLKADQKGVVQFDFRLGIDYGAARILAQVGSNISERIVLQCLPAEEIAKLKNITENTNDQINQ